MAVGLFSERPAKIRTRFAGNLAGKIVGKIGRLDHALLQISGEVRAAVRQEMQVANV